MGNCSEKQPIEADRTLTEEDRIYRASSQFDIEAKAIASRNNALKSSMVSTNKRITLQAGVYEGHISDEVANGRGTLQTDQFVYEGEWKEGKPHGQGEIRYKDGTVYIGSFVEGKPYGEGELVDAEGFIYRGRFVDGLFEGQGEASWANGQQYTGDFKAGKFDGEGIYNWPDGKIYQGGYRDGKRHGKGSILTADGSRIEAFWTDGKVNGDVAVFQGTQTIAQVKYVGDKFVNTRNGHV